MTAALSPVAGGNAAGASAPAGSSSEPAATAGGFEQLLLATRALAAAATPPTAGEAMPDPLASFAAGLPDPDALLPSEPEALPVQAGEDAGSAEEAWPPPGLAGLGWIAAMPLPPEPPAATPVPTGTARIETGVAPPAAAGRTGAPALSAGPLPAPGTAPAAPPPASAIQFDVQPETPAPFALAAAATAAKAMDQAASGGDAPVPVPTLQGVSPQPLGAPALPPTTPATASTDAALPTPDLQGDDFADAFGARLHWLADQKIGHAQIRISPQELGPVEVRLRLDGDRVSADFISAQPEVRQALEQSLPRLGELLGQHGFQLAHADVGQQPRGEGRESPAAAGGPSASSGTDSDEVATQAVSASTAQGLLDAYA